MRRLAANRHAEAEPPQTTFPRQQRLHLVSPAMQEARSRLRAQPQQPRSLSLSGMVLSALGPSACEGPGIADAGLAVIASSGNQRKSSEHADDSTRELRYQGSVAKNRGPGAFDARQEHAHEFESKAKCKVARQHLTGRQRRGFA